MITFMRRYRKGLQFGLLVVIAAFVASLFVFGARGIGDGSRDGDWVASVNGETIPVERYQRRYQAYYDAYSQMYRDKFTPDVATRLGLPQQVVNDLVQEALVVQRARKEGLEVSDAELNAQIQAVPVFQEDGHFSMKLYQEFLRRRGLNAGAFENDVRRELTRMKVENLVRRGVKVSDAEVEHAFKARHESVKTAWALVELAPIVAATSATDDEAQTYLKEHQAEFRQPDRRRMQYVIVSPRDFVKPATDADVEKYYTENARDFETPKQVKAAHILARVPETGGSAAEDKAKAKALEAIKRIKAGEPFAKVAKELSEDPGSAAKGGDLGLISKGEVVPEFEKAAFSMKPGEMTQEPVRSPFGYHVILVSEVKEAARKPLKEVGPIIRQKLSTESADRAAKAKADEVRAALQAAPDFMAEAKKLGLSPIDAKLSRVDTPPGVPQSETMEETAFQLALGGVSAPVNTPAGYIVMKAIEQFPAAVPPLAEIKDQVLAAVRRQKAETVALERAKQIANDAKSSDIVASGKKVGATTGETPPFSQVKPAEKLSGEVMHAALMMPVGGVTPPVKTTQGYYVIKVLERVPADLSEFGKDKEKLTQDLTTQKQGQAWESWVATARAAAKVELSTKLGLPSRRG